MLKTSDRHHYSELGPDSEEYKIRTPLRAGMTVCARYPEDEEFYRARVLSFAQPGMFHMYKEKAVGVLRGWVLLALAIKKSNTIFGQRNSFKNRTDGKLGHTCN